MDSLYVVRHRIMLCSSALYPLSCSRYHSPPVWVEFNIDKLKLNKIFVFQCLATCDAVSCSVSPPAQKYCHSYSWYSHKHWGSNIFHWVQNYILSQDIFPLINFFMKVDVLVVVILRIRVIWDVTLCRLMNDSWHFEGTMILWNVMNHLPNDTASHPRRPEY